MVFHHQWCLRGTLVIKRRMEGDAATEEKELEWQASTCFSPAGNSRFGFLDVPESQVRAGFNHKSSMGCGSAKKSPKGSLGLLILVPAACFPAHLPKAPNSNFPRRFVLLKCFFFCLMSFSEVPLVCTSQEVSKSFTDHSWTHPGMDLDFYKKENSGPKGISSFFWSSQG